VSVKFDMISSQVTVARHTHSVFTSYSLFGYNLIGWVCVCACWLS
jgi:hypothetical protein